MTQPSTAFARLRKSLQPAVHVRFLHCKTLLGFFPCHLGLVGNYLRQKPEETVGSSGSTVGNGMWVRKITFLFFC